MTNLETNSQQLDYYYQALEKLCNEARKKVPEDNCAITLKMISSTLLEIKETNTYFSNLTKSNPNRSKRGLMNIIGRAQKFLFGVMDDEDSDHFQKTVQNLETNQMKMHHSLEKKVSVIVDTLNTTFTYLNDTFTKVESALNTIEKEFHEERETQRRLHLFDEAANILTLATNHLIASQAEFWDIVQEARLGRLDKHLAKSEPFLQALREIQLEGTDHLKLPFKPTVANAQLIAQVSSISPLLTSAKFILEVKVPLIKDTFSLYKLASVPAKLTNETYFYIQTDSPYALIDETHERYAFFKQSDIHKCREFRTEQYICDFNFVSYNFNKKNCIIGLQQGEITPSDCEIRLFNLTHEIWNALSATNNWIYMAPNPTTLRINCENSKYSIPLNGSGLLGLSPGCKARTKEVTLESHSTISNTKVVFYQLDNTQLGDLNLNLSAIPTKDRVPRIILDNQDLAELSVKLKSIVANQPEETNDTYAAFSYDKTTSITLSVVTTILITILFYILCKRYLKCRLTTCLSRQTEIDQLNE